MHRFAVELIVTATKHHKVFAKDAGAVGVAGDGWDAFGGSYLLGKQLDSPLRFILPSFVNDFFVVTQIKPDEIDIICGFVFLIQPTKKIETWEINTLPQIPIQ